MERAHTHTHANTATLRQRVVLCAVGFRQECIFVIKCALTPQCAHMRVIHWVLTLHRKQEVLRKGVLVSRERSCQVV